MDDSEASRPISSATSAVLGFHRRVELGRYRSQADAAAELGRWLLSSLLIVHGGALFSLFLFLALAGERRLSIKHYHAPIYWAVAGIALIVAAGFVAWVNTSMRADMHLNASEGQVPAGQPKPIYTTHWLAISLGILSGLCMFGMAASVFHLR